MATPIEAYIRQAAIQRGIDPNVAVRVAKSEGGLSDPTQQSNEGRNRRREPSYGPFQLLIGGAGTGFPEGVGNRALAAGIDPRDPNQWQRGVDFALDTAAKEGWGQWYGAAKAGIGNRQGIGGGSSFPGKIGGDSMVARNFDPEVAAQTNTPLFGSMSPMADNSIPRGVADFAFAPDKPGLGDRLSAAGAAFDQAANEYPAPKISGGGGDARQSGDALLKFMQNPSALAQMLLKRRMA